MSENFKKVIAYINCENEENEKVIRDARNYENNGADCLFIYNATENEEERESVLALVSDVVRRVDIPVMIGCRISCFEDIKKAFCTGAGYVVLRYDDVCGNDLIKQGCERFGRDAIVLEVNLSQDEKTDFFGDEVMKAADYFGTLLFKHVDVSEKLKKVISGMKVPVIIRDSLIRNDMETLISIDNVSAVATNFYAGKKLPSEDLYTDGMELPAGKDIMKIKRNLKSSGVNVDIFESRLSFADLEKNSDGLVPCIVPDEENDELDINSEDDFEVSENEDYNTNQESIENNYQEESFTQKRIEKRQEEKNKLIGDKKARESNSKKPNTNPYNKERQKQNSPLANNTEEKKTPSPLQKPLEKKKDNKSF